MRKLKRQKLNSLPWIPLLIRGRAGTLLINRGSGIGTRISVTPKSMFFPLHHTDSITQSFSHYSLFIQKFETCHSDSSRTKRALMGLIFVIFSTLFISHTVSLWQFFRQCFHWKRQTWTLSRGLKKWGQVAIVASTVTYYLLNRLVNEALPENLSLNNLNPLSQMQLVFTA